MGCQGRRDSCLLSGEGQGGYQMRWRTILFIFATACSAGPESSRGRYAVTAEPLDVGLHTKLCIAVDPADSAGVWWWEPGAAGCSTRSTGPALMRGLEPQVRLSQPDVVEARFRIGL